MFCGDVYILVIDGVYEFVDIDYLFNIIIELVDDLNCVVVKIVD